MKRSNLFMITALVLAAFTAAPAKKAKTKVVEFRGKAYDLKSGRYLYQEHHREHYRSGKHVYSDVYYKAPGGKVWAYKRIRFTGSRTAPDFRFVDYRVSFKMGSRKRARNFRLYAGEGKSPASKTVRIPGSVVVDGGFDYFIRDNWNKLVAGRVTYANFVVPARKDYFKFQIRKVGNKTVRGRPAHLFRLRMNNAVLRVFVSDLFVAYDKKTKLLLEYKGMTNILNTKTGDNFRARILFPTTRPSPGA